MGVEPAGEVLPDLAQGVTLADFDDRGLLKGRVGDETVLLAHVNGEVYAVGASCTHYGGPLDQGLVVGDTVRCPWHHACFSLRTGEALGAPAFDPVPCWHVVRKGDLVAVRERVSATPAVHTPLSTSSGHRIVIVGGGAAGFACAEMLRRRGHDGSITMLSDDSDAPCDRPNLSKDYLAGNAPEEWIPLRSSEFYTENRIDLRLGTRVTSIDVSGRSVVTENGRAYRFDRLLLATGAEPVRLPIPGSDRDHVLTLRSLADSRAVVARAGTAKSAVVLGSGFIGLEVAASLRTRGLDVHVVSLDERPLERVLGAGLGDFIRGLHEQHGVRFHMGTSIASISDTVVRLTNGTDLAADLVISGVGVRPRMALAEAAGLAVDRGVLVNACLETNVPGIFAAGDIARWPGDTGDQTHRIEHWVVAERHGQVVAENMLGVQTPYRDVPFFWSAHYDVTIRYAGYARRWDTISIEGDIAAQDCLVSYVKDGTVLAVAAMGRDAEVLEFSARASRPRY